MPRLSTLHPDARRVLLAPSAAGLLLLTACSSASAPATTTPPVAACTFTNPVMPGADPWVVRHDSAYYTVQSRNAGGRSSIWVYRSPKLTDPDRDDVQVWTAPASGWNRTNVWAPELHRIDGRWYIYYAAGSDGPPFIHQRSGVLEATGDDPQGPFVDRGMLYTGTSVGADTTNYWAIDLTVGRIGGQLYAVWSGWEQNATTDRTPQHLYAARMSSPTRVSSDRVRISSPTADWERGTELDLQEGPEFVANGDATFIVYSTRESWLKDYRLGTLRLSGADPLAPGSWAKSSGPVFTGNTTTYGVGHASFTMSPDSTEWWIAYHSKIDPSPGWNRSIRLQRFSWGADGAPQFGAATSAGVSQRVPSGECS